MGRGHRAQNNERGTWGVGHGAKRTGHGAQNPGQVEEQ